MILTLNHFAATVARGCELSAELRHALALVEAEMAAKPAEAPVQWADASLGLAERATMLAQILRWLISMLPRFEEEGILAAAAPPLPRVPPGLAGLLHFRQLAAAIDSYVLSVSDQMIDPEPAWTAAGCVGHQGTSP